MKWLIIGGFLLCFYSNGFAQKSIFDDIRLCFDYSISKKVVDSLKNQGINTIFVYQSEFDSVKYKCNLLRNCATNVVTYIGWVENRTIRIFMVTDRSISKTNLISDTLLKFKDLNKLWITKNERRIEILAPDMGYMKSIFIFFVDSKSYFFEYGPHNLYYELDKSKNKYRERFFFLLENELSKLNSDWELDRYYDRSTDFKKIK